MEKSHLPTVRKSKKVKTETPLAGIKMPSPLKGNSKALQLREAYCSEETERIKPVISNRMSPDMLVVSPIESKRVMKEAVCDITVCDVTVSDVTADAKPSSVSRLTKMRPCKLYFLKDIVETSRTSDVAVGNDKNEAITRNDLRETLAQSSSPELSFSDDETSKITKKRLLFEQTSTDRLDALDFIPGSAKIRGENFQKVEIPLSSWIGVNPRKSKSIGRLEYVNLNDKYTYCPLNNELDNSPIYHELDPIDMHHTTIHTYQSIVELREDLRVLREKSELKGSGNSNNSDVSFEQTIVELLPMPDATTQPASTAVSLLPEKDTPQKISKHFFFSKLRLPRRNSTSRKQLECLKHGAELEKLKSTSTIMASYASTKKTANSAAMERVLFSPKIVHAHQQNISTNLFGTQNTGQLFDVCDPTAYSPVYYAHIKKSMCDAVPLEQSSPPLVRLSTFAKAPSRLNDMGKPSLLSMTQGSRSTTSGIVENSSNPNSSMSGNVLEVFSSRTNNISSMDTCSCLQDSVAQSRQPTIIKSYGNQKQNVFNKHMERTNISYSESLAEVANPMILRSDKTTPTLKPTKFQKNSDCKQLAAAAAKPAAAKLLYVSALSYGNTDGHTNSELQTLLWKANSVESLSFDNNLSSRDSSEHLNLQCPERRITFASPSCGIRMAKMRAVRRTSECMSPSPELMSYTPPPSCLPRFFSSVQPNACISVKNKKDASSQTLVKSSSRALVTCARTKMNTIVEEEPGVVGDEKPIKCFSSNNDTDKVSVTASRKLPKDLVPHDDKDSSANSAKQPNNNEMISVTSIVPDLRVLDRAHFDLRPNIPIPAVDENKSSDVSTAVDVHGHSQNLYSPVVSVCAENVSMHDSLLIINSGTGAPIASNAKQRPSCDLFVCQKLNNAYLDYSELNFDTLSTAASFSERHGKATSTLRGESERDAGQKGCNSRLKPPKRAKCMTTPVSSIAVAGGDAASPAAAALPNVAYSNRCRSISGQHRHLLPDVKSEVIDIQLTSRVAASKSFCVVSSSSIINVGADTVVVSMPQPTIIKRASVRNIESSGSGNIAPVQDRDGCRNRNLNSENTLSIIRAVSESCTATPPGCRPIRSAKTPHSATTGVGALHITPPVAVGSRCYSDQKQLRPKSVNFSQTSSLRVSSSTNCTNIADAASPWEIDSDCPQKTIRCTVVTSSIPQPSSSAAIHTTAAAPPTDRSLSLSSSSTGSSTGSVVSAADSESEVCIFSYKKKLAVFERRDSALPTFRLNLISDRQKNCNSSPLTNKFQEQQRGIGSDKSLKCHSARTLRVSGSRIGLLSITANQEEGFDSKRLDGTEESSRPSSGKSYSEDERSDYASSTGN